MPYGTIASRRQKERVNGDNVNIISNGVHDRLWDACRVEPLATEENSPMWQLNRKGRWGTKVDFTTSSTSSGTAIMTGHGTMPHSIARDKKGQCVVFL